jgi:hypothetical protein
MVYRAWFHLCCAHLDVGIRAQFHECHHCGQPGLPDGWGRSLVEKWGLHSRQWGLSPTRGPRSNIEVVEPLSEVCPTCDGWGLQSRWDECLDCPMCGGTGRLWVADDDEIDRVYARLAAKHPDCGIHRPDHRRLTEVS